MKDSFKWLVSGWLMILLTLSPMGSMYAVGSERHGSEKVYKNAGLKKKTEGTLTFVIDRKGRMATVKGRLSDRTRMKDRQGQAIRAEALEEGSVWTVRMRYPRDQEGVPVIVDMRKTRGKTPQ